MQHTSRRLERTLIVSILLLLFWLPLPLGSNIDWAVGVFIFWVAATALAWSIGVLRNPQAMQGRALRAALPIVSRLEDEVATAVAAATTRSSA